LAKDDIYKSERIVMKYRLSNYSRYGSAKEIATRIKDKLKAELISDITDLKMLPEILSLSVLLFILKRRTKVFLICCVIKRGY